MAKVVALASAQPSRESRVDSTLRIAALMAVDCLRCVFVFVLRGLAYGTHYLGKFTRHVHAFELVKSYQVYKANSGADWYSDPLLKPYVLCSLDLVCRHVSGHTFHRQVQ